VYFGARLEGICTSMTALIDSWASLKVTKHLEGEEFGLLSGGGGVSRAKEV
jgi:hypothetical protein